MRSRRFIMLMASMVLFASSMMQAQESDTSKGRQRKRVSIEDVNVQGRIVKPSVQFFVSREKSQTGEALNLQENFVDHIVESVNSAPF